MTRIWVMFCRVVFLCVAVAALASCGSDGDADAAPAVADDGSEGDGSEEGASDGSSSDADGSDADGSGPDNDDAAEITGNEDLDLDELAEVSPDAAEALDDIDDIVSIGDCESEAVGLAMSFVPNEWQCRVLDAPIGDLDGFTLFKPGNPGGLEITIGTPSPFGPPCELLQACDGTEPIDLSSNFDTTVFELGGVPFISGTHKTVEAEVVVTTTSPLSDSEREFVTSVLDGVVEL